MLLIIFRKEHILLMVKNLIKTINNPVKIYLIWFLLIILFCIIGIPILSMNKSGGEQVPLILLGYAIGSLVYGFFIISILTSLKLEWFKKYWYVNILVFLITSFLIILVLL